MPESARKAYSVLGSAQRHYKERRFRIRQQLPNLKGYELESRVQDLNGELAELRDEVAECESAIAELKQGKDPEPIRRKFRVSYPINARSKDLIESFKFEIDWRKQVAYWIRRESQILVWEIRKRRLQAAKLPITRRQRTSLNKKALELLCQIKSLSEQLTEACQAYQKTCSEHYGLSRELEKLSFNSEEKPSGRIWVNVRVPSEIKELKFLRDLELEEEGKGKLRKLLRI